MRVFHLTGDLMLSSQAASAAARVGASYALGASPESLISSGGDPVDVVLWDLACGNDPASETAERIRQKAPAARIVAYAPHVHEDRLAAAQAAGCDEVLSRGQFVRDLARLCGALRS
jgi:DNA-binding NarL/FixJ family response regulator